MSNREEKKENQASPQEKAAVTQIIREREQMDKMIINMSHNAPDRGLENAQQQFDDYKDFFEEIWMDLNELEKRK